MPSRIRTGNAPQRLPATAISVDLRAITTELTLRHHVAEKVRLELGRILEPTHLSVSQCVVTHPPDAHRSAPRHEDILRLPASLTRFSRIAPVSRQRPRRFLQKKPTIRQKIGWPVPNWDSVGWRSPWKVLRFILTPGSSITYGDMPCRVSPCYRSCRTPTVCSSLTLRCAGAGLASLLELLSSSPTIAPIKGF